MTENVENLVLKQLHAIRATLNRQFFIIRMGLHDARRLRLDGFKFLLASLCAPSGARLCR
ncbi:hypothetical protein [uncultured Thiocystis sp.]|uniref:hypothetical protein n=1 Tax=uncultured Thiocystis sp. TaxID=1202134 RepID=UPI0025E89DC0|nr:hypothetical protein [uncultured Thiocystis sp.]